MFKRRPVRRREFEGKQLMNRALMFSQTVAVAGVRCTQR